MHYLHNQPWAAPDDVELDGDVQWNLWTTRQSPYNQVEAGDRVLLCCPAPEGSRITFEVELTQVEKAPYASKREAHRVIDAAFPYLRMDFRSFRTAPYTLQAPESGHLLAFSYDPVQELQVTRPVDWKLRPNGWLVLTDEQAGQALAQAAKTGQGPLLNPAMRRAVELRAMKVAKQWLVKERGFDAVNIRDTSVGHPYDFEAGPADAPVLRVEVKGLSGKFGPVFVTAGEVASATKGGVSTVMLIVSDIRLSGGPDGPVGQGGDLAVIDPWAPTVRQLKALQYQYQPPK